MRYFEKEIHVDLDTKVEKPAILQAYIVDNYEEIDLDRRHPAVIILPGGAYRFTSERESEAIAFQFLAQGISAFILKYHVAPTTFPYALCEALKSIEYVRSKAKEFNIDSNNISVCGFSAGGHLAASTGVHWNKENILDLIHTTKDKVKPNKLILSYPVITSGEYRHKGSFENLLGQDILDEELLEFNRLEKQVGTHTPPTFLWHTYEDNAVPVQNSLFFASALIENKIPTELHIYPKGDHGLSLGNFLVYGNKKYGENHISSDWIEKAIRFIYTC